MGPLGIIIVQIVVGVILTALFSRTQGSSLKKKGLDDFTFPTVSSDRSIPVFFGDVLVEGPNVTWFGDYAAKTVKDGGGLLTSGVEVAVRYYIGMEIVIGWGETDSITELWFGEEVAWSGNVTTQGEVFLVDNKSLFGGTGNGGGVRAYVGFYKGTATQLSDAYMESMVGEAYNHRGISKLVWYGPSAGYGEIKGLVGESNYVPPIKIRAQRYPNFLGTPYSVVPQSGANPAEVIYAILTGKYINLNTADSIVPRIPPTQIDTATFVACATTLYNEGMGINFQWQRDAPPAEIISDIENHINGQVIQDAASGLLQLVLKRQDYDPNTVPVFDSSNIKDMPSMVRINPTIAVNRIIATYTDVDQAWKQIPIMIEDLGNSYEQDMRAPLDLDLHMFHSPDAVNQRGSQELIQRSEGIIAGELVANRDAYLLNIAQVIKINWAPRGLSDVLVRVTEIAVGDLEKREIRVKYIQDIYGIGTAVYGGPTNSSWTDIYSNPQDIVYYSFFELPYYMLERSDIPTANYVMTTFVKFPTPDTYAYKPLLKLATDPANSYLSYDLALSYNDTDNTVLAFDYAQTNGPAKDTVTGIIVVGRPPDDAVSTVTFTDIQNAFKNWCMVGNELMAYESVTDMGDGTWRLNNVYRGLLDTSPANHLAGDIIWFINESFEPYSRSFASLEQFDMKTLTSSGGGILDESAAAAKPYTLVNRYDMPLRPANIQVNAEYYPVSISGSVTVTWNDRNRTLTATLADWDDASQALETNQTTSIKIYDALSVLIHTETGLVGNSYNYPLTQEILDAGTVQTQLTIEVYCERDGYVSYDPFVFTFSRATAGDPENLTFNLDQVTSSSAGNVNLNLNELIA